MLDSAISSAVADAPHAINTARLMRSGNETSHSSARCPPMDPPIRTLHSVMPRPSASADSITAWSRTVTIGKFAPKGLPVTGSIEEGPVVPWHPPKTFGQTTK